MRRALPLLVAVLLAALPALAHADAAYDRVAQAYADGNGRIDACFFTQQELEAGLAGIPAELADVVPDIRAAIAEAVATHTRGECAGRQPGVPSSADQGGAIPPVTTTPAVPTTTTPAASTPPVVTTPPERDRTPLLVALIVLGALALAALATWGLGRMRGWDPQWLSRTRHAWGEAGFRVSTTWSEFGDWLRLGR
jgi:hypothetical protein